MQKSRRGLQADIPPRITDLNLPYCAFDFRILLFFLGLFYKMCTGGHPSLVPLWQSFAGGSTTSATARDFFNPRESDLRAASRHPYLQMLNLETHHSPGAGQYCPCYFGPVSPIDHHDRRGPLCHPSASPKLFFPSLSTQSILGCALP